MTKYQINGIHLIGSGLPGNRLNEIYPPDENRMEEG